jgi:uncharacterized protein (DUF2267 family)
MVEVDKSPSQQLTLNSSLNPQLLKSSASPHLNSRGSDRICVMDYDEFLAQVQHRAKLASQEEAESAIRATLETLAERITSDESTDLASQLPEEIADWLARATEDDPESFSLEEFYQRVAVREGIDTSDAVFHVRAVCEVLNEAVSPGDLEDICSHLPAEFRAAIEAGREQA